MIAAASPFACARGGSPSESAPDASPDVSFVFDTGSDAVAEAEAAAFDTGFPTFEATVPDVDGDAPSPKPVVGLALGSSYACARHADGAVRCWGTNVAGNLGNGSVEGSTKPALVGALGHSVEVATASSGMTTCAVRDGVGIACWGLFDDPGVDERCFVAGANVPCETTPTPIDVDPTITRIALSLHAGCGIRDDGTVACWGNDPTPANALTDVAQIAFGEAHGCVRTNAGAVACWGDDSFDQLGAVSGEVCGADFHPCSSQPVEVAGLSGVTQLALGAEHTCALLGDGTVRCWGGNRAGQLGYGATDQCTRDALPCSAQPHAVAGLSGVVALAAAGLHTCAVMNDRSVRCWGSDDWGELGVDAKEMCGGQEAILCATTPTPIAQLTDIVEVACGRRDTCARDSNGAAWCWGANEAGQLGDGSTIGRSKPERVFF